eukprot:gene7672-7874_t
MQVAAGRVAALKAMKQELLSQAVEAFPEDTAVYTQVVASKAAQPPASSHPSL